MNRDYDMNLAEENNYSIITNDELQDMTSFSEYSSYVVTSSANFLPDKTYNSSVNQHTNYSNSKPQQPSTNLQDNMFASNGSSAGNASTQESFRQYMDQLTAYLVKNDPKSLQYLIENINKCKNGEMDVNETGRTTPLRFSDIHAMAKLDFPGLLYQLIPNTLNHSGGIITITDEIYPKYYDFQFDDYPGPLSLEKTTEEQIFYYLKDQMSVEFHDTLPSDSDSEKLLINYLELLIKENGKARMSNIVRLLNDGMETKSADLQKDYKSYDSISRNSFSRASSRATSRASSRAVSPESKEMIDNDLPQNSLDTPRGPGSVSSVMRRAATTVAQDEKLFQNMDKYREYIWSGRFEEAVNFAMRAGIWDHAFALALRMNNSVLVNEILVRFSRRAIHSNDPLFTMHELMAARPPRIVATNRGFSNSEMNDWRSHLSMILAVKKFRPDESRQAIESMGDKLMSLHCYFAAHLCYLLADTPFGVDKTAHKYRRKYDLIGWFSSTVKIPAQKSTFEFCHKLFSGINYWQSAPQQYIKFTEIYEYVLKLRNDDSHKTLSVHMLPYKYLMAHRLLAQHHTMSAYEYCRNIGEILGTDNINWLTCESVNFHIVSNIRNLSYKLHSLLTTDNEYGDNVDTGDNSWLDNIDNVYCQFCDKYKFWNPKSMKPDFFREEFLEKVADEVVSVVDLNSQIRQDVADQSTIANNYPESVNSSLYSRQQHHELQQQYQLQQFQQQQQLQQQQLQQQQLQQQQLQQQQLQQQQLQQQELLQRHHQLQQKQQQQKYQEDSNQQFSPEQPHIRSANSIQNTKKYSKPFDNIDPNQIPAGDFQSQQIPSNFPQKSGSIGSTGMPSSYQYPRPHELPSTTKNAVYPTQMKYPFTANNFSDIPPPSELPTEAIMTSPPRRFDIKNTNSTNVDASRDRRQSAEKYDNRTMTSQNTDYNHTVFNHNPSIGEHNFPMPQEPHDPNYVTDNQLPYSVIANQSTGYSYGNEAQYQYTNSEQMSQDANQMSSGMFMPSANDEMRGSCETVDCFAITPGYSRSRSQSNGSVGSADSQIKSVSRHSISRSRNSSESKDPKVAVSGHVSSRSLETTKEEIEVQKQEKTKNENSSTTEKKTGWNPLGWFSSSKSKDVHLPDDNEKTWEYDAVKNRWINKTESQTEKPPTPPPKMPVSQPQFPIGFMSPTSQYQGAATQGSLSRYRQASPNVRPSLNTPDLPSYPKPVSIPTNQSTAQYINPHYNDSGPYSTNIDNQYNNSNQLNYHSNNYQMDGNAPYNSNSYQNNQQTMMNQ